MKKKMNYVVLDATCDNPAEAFDELADSVADYLNGGYALQGGVSLAFVPAKSQFSDSKCYIAAQAMTKEVNVYGTGCGEFVATDINLEEGKVLVLLGAQSSDKTTLAQEIAAQYGGSEFYHMSRVSRDAKFSAGVVIVEDVIGLGVGDIERIKGVLAAYSAMPHLILCAVSPSAEWLKDADADDSIFHVIKL